MASIYQREAGDSIIHNFTEAIPNIRWVVLFAQMQSGKTSTYLYVACESLRKGIVRQVIIFSGNSEKELKLQVMSDCESFVERYAIENSIDIHTYNRIRKSIKVLWGADLTNIRSAETDTLFIWDESHSAQSTGMRPDKFLKANGIHGNGVLNNVNNYFLSVSATPFSEISDIIHESQFKAVIKLSVGPEYFSLQNMMENGNIRTYTDFGTTLMNAFIEHSESRGKYAIVRVRNDTIGETVRRLASRYGWATKVYNSNVKEIGSMSEMETAPLQNTVIIIKGMCRMGKVVPKRHVAFCMETSNKPNTDVVLQGLLGRMMGWNANRDVVVYLNENIFNENELNKYVRLYNGDVVIPRKATNMKQNRVVHSASELYPIIPVCITPQNRIVDGSRDDLGLGRNNHRQRRNNNSQAIIESVKAAFADERVENFNDRQEFLEIRENVLNFDIEMFEVRHVRTQPTYRDVRSNIEESIRTRTPKKLGTSCGIKSDGTEIKIYTFADGNWYIDARISTCNDAYKNYLKFLMDIPETTKKEVFCRKEETGEEVFNNGGYNVSLPIESSTNVDAMLTGLRDLITLSNQATNLIQMPRKVTSNKDDTGMWQGICVTSDVLNALMRRGVIFETLKREYNVILKVSKSRGRQNVLLTESGLTRLTEISW
jgi:hypothetical protein